MRAGSAVIYKYLYMIIYSKISSHVIMFCMVWSGVQLSMVLFHRLYSSLSGHSVQDNYIASINFLLYFHFK